MQIARLSTLQKAIHERLLTLAKNYQRIESEFIEILQKCDDKKVFRALGYSSLFQYAVQELKLSEPTALNFISVSRKAKEVPAIQQEIKEGNLTVARARKILPVITQSNANEWLDKAKSLPKLQLEKEVAKVAPQVLTPEKVSYVSENRMKMQLGISEELQQKLKRIQDILSQKTKKAVSMEQALEEMASFFLEKKDPVHKAERALEKEKPEEKESSLPTPYVHGHVKRSPISARTKHEIIAKTGGQCTSILPTGERCDQKRWLEFHHKHQVSHGGDNGGENLQLLCFHHHKMQHESGMA